MKIKLLTLCGCTRYMVTHILPPKVEVPLYIMRRVTGDPRGPDIDAPVMRTRTFAKTSVVNAEGVTIYVEAGEGTSIPIAELDEELLKKAEGGTS